MQVMAILFLVLFAVAMMFEYVAVRRGWLKLPVALIGGMLVNSLCFIIYSVASGTPLLNALAVGAFIGSLFTIMAMIAASYFNNQQQARVLTMTDMQQVANAESE
ncbi:MAG: hypothetical protein KF726_15040 [Anaerolineae bacterium]|nr:hypothetical protein [Anaerolineae bacterium]